MMRFSVVIPNFNYGRYLAEAIDSALALDWQDVEVIVVDDASTDDSADVVRSYGDRVTALLLQVNGGQRQACNAGWERTSGDVVIFLDADDVLQPQAARRISEAWGPSVSKVQYQLARIDADGKLTGSLTPTLDPTPTPADIRRWYLSTTAYPTPPGSGNAYSRAFLEQLMPLSDKPDPKFSDSALLSAAPLLGDVVSIREPLALYRVHGANDSNLLSEPQRFAREVQRAVARAEFAAAIGESDPGAAPSRVRRSREVLGFRVAARRLSPQSPTGLPSGTLTLLADALRSPFAPGPESWKKRLVIAGWSTVALLAPRSVAERLVQKRFQR